MKFFYNLERFEGGEYVVVALEWEGKRGVGAVVPRKERGENYKTVMGAIEEYRHVVEKMRPEQFASISIRLAEEFPNHPSVTFAISAAALELFSKLNGFSIPELLMCERGSAPLYEWEGEVVVPEDVGGVFEVLSLASDERALVVREYPNGEMREVLAALSCHFAGYIPL